MNVVIIEGGLLILLLEIKNTDSPLLLFLCLRQQFHSASLRSTFGRQTSCLPRLTLEYSIIKL